MINVEPLKVVFEIHALARNEDGHIIAEPVVRARQGADGPERLVLYTHQFDDLRAVVARLLVDVEAQLAAAPAPDAGRADVGRQTP